MSTEDIDLAKQAEELRKEAEETRRKQPEPPSSERSEKLSQDVDSSVKNLRDMAKRLR